MAAIHRRTFLSGVLGTGLLAACGRGSTEATPAERSSEPKFLRPSFPVGFGTGSILAAGSEQRLTFVVRDDLDVMRATAPDALDIRVTLDGTEVGGGQTPRRSDGLITPYYPVFFTPAVAGTYEASLFDRSDVEPVVFEVLDRGDIRVPLVGDPMRSVNTPTFDQHLGIDPICTRAVPCPFHEIDLAQALDNGRPTVLVIATPGFCQTDICGPVVDLLIAAAPDRPDVDFIHAEVYTDPSIFETGKFPPTTPAVDINELPFEPVIYLADADAVIRASLSTMWDASELTEALATV